MTIDTYSLTYNGKVKRFATKLKKLTYDMFAGNVLFDRKELCFCHFDFKAKQPAVALSVL